MTSDDVIVNLTVQVKALVAEVKLIREHLAKETDGEAEASRKSRRTGTA